MATPAHHGGRRGSLVAAKEVLCGSYAGCAGSNCSINSHGRLEVGGLPEEDPYANGWRCWFCGETNNMTRSHVLPPKLRAVRVQAWEGEEPPPGASGFCLANPRWGRRFARFLELSGVGPVVERWNGCFELIRFDSI